MKAFVLTVFLGVMCLLTQGAAMATPLKVGDMAPNFKIMTTDSTVFSLGQWRGKKPVYLVFWNTWCPYCVKKMPVYQNTHTFHGEELAVLLINTGNKDPFDNLKPFAERHELDLPMAYDFGSKVSLKFGILGTPTAFIIDINGRIRHLNSIPDDVEELIPGWSE
ncbi:MAG: TlpA family protein disulfide reductase [Psychrosphaera sp.]|nr:TlpA family protein disulfide reductase [Psychrosphaera sp.]